MPIHLDPSDPALGQKVEDLEAFAAKIQAKQPAPGDVSMETAMFFSILACDDEAVLEKLRYNFLRGDFHTVVNTLEEAGKHDKNDVLMLRKCIEEDDQVGTCNALRRMTGDTQAGRDDDEFRAFYGQGFVRRSGEGRLEKLPFLEEKSTAGYRLDGCTAWRASFKHTSCHYIPPAIMPNMALRHCLNEADAGREAKDTGHQAISVYALGAEYDWERSHVFNVIEANIANANADYLTGCVDPNSGAMVNGNFDREFVIDIANNG